eukprot:gene26161-biopygen14494
MAEVLSPARRHQALGVHPPTWSIQVCTLLADAPLALPGRAKELPQEGCFLEGCQKTTQIFPKFQVGYI